MRVSETMHRVTAKASFQVSSLEITKQIGEFFVEIFSIRINKDCRDKSPSINFAAISSRGLTFSPLRFGEYK